MVVWGGGIASVVALAFAWHLSKTISDPLSDLSRAARMMASGRLDSRVSPKGPLETRELGASFNYMAQAIEATMERQEQFLMAAAHELRAPLASMRALVESMEISPPEPDELPELIDDIHTEILDLQQTAESILSLLRAGSGSAPSRPQQVNPAKIVEDLIKSRAATISQRNLEILQRYPTAGEVPIDPLLFRLIVGNLLDNAIKFTPPGGTVAVALENCNKMVLKVSDNGPGIPPEHLDKIFDRFYRVDPARQKVTGGAGLGLAIVKEACEKTAGVIHVETSPGEGTVFTVEWHNIR